ncbi:hypothetical protein [Anaerosolibacter sp.]|uniref:hypothetical protein n=1 Tax=Anaerosolibacter sp. TaxID=1872527 RepID=UPI00261385D8|nr:hypothetical protein [Anaerosolibacter sp.]
MKVFGYQKDSEELIELQEVSFQSDIRELDKIIEFLQEVKEHHSKVIGEVELCHSHFRDWDVGWKAGSTDIIVVTTSKDK